MTQVTYIATVKFAPSVTMQAGVELKVRFWFISGV